MTFHSLAYTLFRQVLWTRPPQTFHHLPPDLSASDKVLSCISWREVGLKSSLLSSVTRAWYLTRSGPECLVPTLIPNQFGLRKRRLPISLVAQACDPQGRVTQRWTWVVGRARSSLGTPQGQHRLSSSCFPTPAESFNVF